MFYWQISIVVLLVGAVVGLPLRAVTEYKLDTDIKWTKDGAKFMWRVLRHKEPLLFWLLVIEGAVTNLSLGILVTSIPAYFIYGI